MNRSTANLMVCVFALVAALLADNASAGLIPINVPNYSFESPNLGGPGGYFGPNGTITIPGWTFQVSNGSDVGGIQNQGPNGGGGPNTGNPIGTDQNQWAFLNLSNMGSTPTSGTITSAASVATIQPNVTYYLTAAVGSNTQLGGYQDAGNFFVSLLANGVPVASNGLLASDNVKGTLQNLTVSFTAPASGGVDGQSLTIQLGSTSSNSSDPFGGQQSLFDNVRLASTPEPSSLVLCGFGALGLLIAVRKRRQA